MIFGLKNRGVINTQPAIGRQMKQIVDYKQNFRDVFGTDWRFWAMPCAPAGDQPALDGYNWHMRSRD